ncbi:hypothetical protein ACIP2Y_45150 [Streptomyces sviceus]|uniref:hypothetical protein n=1 Tax=Streptomyces sviceus TaxID=285530 RepID=UPI00382A0FC2
MTRRVPCLPVPGPLEAYAARFDDLFSTLAQRRGFREYLAGLLLARDRNKTPTCLVGTEPIVGAHHASVQRLQFGPIAFRRGGEGLGGQVPADGVDPADHFDGLWHGARVGPSVRGCGLARTGSADGDDCDGTAWAKLL